MDIYLSILCLTGIGIICFKLGMHWEAKTMKDNIKKTGTHETKWGESSDTKFKVTGTIESI